ncbi:hypothetical protein INR49_013893 [Caranx melampygus]|nr:hypothetical protein INR49_013893 [Caranx melampygus]
MDDSDEDTPETAAQMCEEPVKQTKASCLDLGLTVNLITNRKHNGAVVEETIRGVVAAAAHSSSAVSVVVGLTLFVKVGSRGLREDREGTILEKWDTPERRQTVVDMGSSTPTTPSPPPPGQHSPFPQRQIPSSRVSVWRCPQQVTRTANYSSSPGHLLHSTASTVFHSSRAASTNQLLSIKPLSWHASCLCHGNSRGTTERENTKEGFSLRALTQAPKPALYLGFSGLIPFLSAPLLMAATQSFYPEVAYAQVVYGASIVSFLGGARWGFAIPAGSPAQPDWMNLGNSVVPSLVAWLALLCRDNITEGALVVIMGLGLSLHYDLTLLPGYPAWFKAMRTVLTLVATFSLVATLTIKKLCSEKKIKEIQN